MIRQGRRGKHATCTRPSPTIASMWREVVFHALLELGADPQALDRYGQTPMDHAVENPWLQGWGELRR